MKIKLYGVRGSLPTPLPGLEYRNKLEKVLLAASEEFKKHNGNFSVSKFISELDPNLSSPVGGNTTCVYVESDAGDRYVIDCGSGMRLLGNDLLDQGIAKNGTVNVLVTHTHWDHIQGWPFFKPGYIPTVKIEFYSTIQNLKERFERQQHPENFPITLDSMASQKTFHVLERDKTVQIGSLKVTPFLLRHPGNCTGYRFEENGKSFLFCTDVEVQEEDLEEIKELRARFGKTDLLVIDAQYSSEEAPKKVGWGHTSGKNAVRCGEIFEVELLVLTHHEPDHADEEISKIFQKEKQNARLPKIHLARELDTFQL
ncbi:MBL fold metallo-hydrolase [Leptospira perolatii]|uniref:MBL fold metallo-hydrolase n=1 Tax=Leptospira perolatii TaxID=2023191 RepID=A0A2M9ZRD7_9LEPT|nr:MBL fold metallo-hydrolase [Leptospira perolatii]PJZ71115.1 MBL fold metallo-hydrolase [Leptospira perolatii]PJZ74647.1 MBL fold metallo-hydrolase [Leptospira perolatii]